MSKNANNVKTDRTAVLANLAKVWPEAKLGRVANDDLLWLLEVAACMESGPRDMSSTLQKYRVGYVPTTAYSGRASLNNGDPIAEHLAGMSPLEVMQEAERLLGLDNGELVARYENLNPGQQRMNAGNRIRAAIKRGDLTVDQLH